jgi:hypothetical protein
MDACFSHQYTRVQCIAALICILWNIYTINSFNPLGSISYVAVENFQCKWLCICTWFVELYHSELYGEIPLKSKVLLFTKEYYTTPCKRNLFEKLTVVKMICHFLIFLGMWRFITASITFCNLTVFYQMYAVHVLRACVVKKYILILSPHICLGLIRSWNPELNLYLLWILSVIKGEWLIWARWIYSYNLHSNSIQSNLISFNNCEEI